VHKVLKVSLVHKVHKDHRVHRVNQVPMLYGTLLVRMVLVLVMPLVTLLHTLARLGIEYMPTEEIPEILLPKEHSGLR
jgi:hypothetical protein